MPRCGCGRTFEWCRCTTYYAARWPNTVPAAVPIDKPYRAPRRGALEPDPTLGQLRAEEPLTVPAWLYDEPGLAFVWSGAAR